MELQISSHLLQFKIYRTYDQGPVHDTLFRKLDPGLHFDLLLHLRKSSRHTFSQNKGNFDLLYTICPLPPPSWTKKHYFKDYLISPRTSWAFISFSNILIGKYDKAPYSSANVTFDVINYRTHALELIISYLRTKFELDQTYHGLRGVCNTFYKV